MTTDRSSTKRDLKHESDNSHLGPSHKENDRQEYDRSCLRLYDCSPKDNSSTPMYMRSSNADPPPIWLPSPLLQKTHRMKSTPRKNGVITALSFFVCIIAIRILGSNAYTKQHLRNETLTSPHSALSATIAPPISADQTAPPRQDAQSLHRIALHSPSRMPAQSPGLKTVATPPLYSSEGTHGRFHHHLRSFNSRQDDDDQHTVSDKPQRHRVPANLRTHQLASPASPSPPNLETRSTATTTNKHAPSSTSSSSPTSTLPTKQPNPTLRAICGIFPCLSHYSSST